ncbi:oxidoreductase [Paenibacillus montaniterrae]|uniref:Oxidoreductase n=1 Tax=Paenibacillus montaniterrae TaxID=429341 RepID=A0A919YMN1_9BACL|nr:Gfo/Idh/MocA family oxidoreductase [Paenibacillus montaniterrae]GIP17267.1 oxidoreductase [Paenibacillus montaniterrae]
MSTYKVIIAGCGHMAHVWADYALTREDTVIVGLVDIYEEAAAKFAEKKQLSCPIFTDIETAIQATGANLVFDVTVPASHYTIASTAMRLGCDVFSEKPLAESLTQCLELVQLSRSLGRTHAIMQNRRFDPRIRALRQMIASNTIGTVGFASADFFIAPHFGGFRDAMESPLLLDMAIHTFDQARYIMGANPVSVYCHEFNPKGSWYKGNAMALCIFEMSDGSVFDYRGSWCAEGAPTSWEAAWRVIGDQGTIIWDGHKEPYAECVINESQERKFLSEHQRIDSEPVEMPLTFHQGCLANMFAALETGTPPETSSSDNIYSMAMVLAALESAKLGAKVDIQSFMKQ